jgi:hypothetical protein
LFRDIYQFAFKFQLVTADDVAKKIFWQSVLQQHQYKSGLDHQP